MSCFVGPMMFSLEWRNREKQLFRLLKQYNWINSGMTLCPEFEPFTLHFVKRTAATAGSCCLFTIDFSQNTLRHVISVMDSDRSHNEDNSSFQVSFIYKAQFASVGFYSLDSRRRRSGKNKKTKRAKAAVCNFILKHWKHE